MHRRVVYIVSTAEEWDQCFNQLLRDAEKTKMLGIDCEWVMKRPVALLQIASSSGVCVLVRLFKLGHAGIPQSLKTLLSDRSILKLGVAVNDDAKKLLRDYDLKLIGCVDLRHILQRVRGVYKCRSWGLQGLAKGVLNFTLSKDFRVRCGNWEAHHLSPRQTEYAALDALVAVDIFTHLVVAKVTGTDPQSHPQSAAQVTLSSFLATSRSLCQGILGAGFSREVSQGKGDPKPGKRKEKKLNGEMYSTRSRPLWDNCELLAPDGQPLCTCDSRKAAWYIKRGLGDKVSDNPLVVKLRFEPSGRPKSSRNYYLQQKENLCVVCGKTESYARKFIVPQEYRKFFPLLLKEHTSHDVLLMCPQCHRVSSDYDGLLRQQLANECQAPLNSGQNSSTFQDHFLQQVKSAGRALKLNRGKIPAPRVQELEKTVMDYFGVSELTPELIEDSCNVDIRLERGGYVNHAHQVVKHMAEHGGLIQFQARWRRHFVQTMKPQHLPAYWSVDYVPENWKEDSDDDDDDDDGDDSDNRVAELGEEEDETDEENEGEFESEEEEEEEEGSEFR
ncbi:hypothetical protein ACOMHN_048596 [Nucella lapillus]